MVARHVVRNQKKTFDGVVYENGRNVKDQFMMKGMLLEINAC